MSEYDRTVYIVRWECDTIDYWVLVGTYRTREKAIAAGKQFQENNIDGRIWIDTVILPARI